MSDSLRLLLDHLLLLSERIGDSLSRVTYTPPESSNVNIKSTVESLLPNRGSPSLSEISEVEVCAKISDFTLCCAALAAASESTYGELLWIPDSLSEAAVSAFKQLSEAYSTFLRPKNCMKVGELEFELKFMSSDVRLQRKNSCSLCNSCCSPTQMDCYPGELSISGEVVLFGDSLWTDGS
ncbi:unnamed protein product [Cuscuta europaea]|uniref:Uncharacterized protein n=1 Tax=Cuscuta europaea TaxID=41803 RepID=A0A9P1EF50_CUSEU|nr:unnamed protein product [Cuscuta europaea]